LPIHRKQTISFNNDEMTLRFYHQNIYYLSFLLFIVDFVLFMSNKNKTLTVTTKKNTSLVTSF
jgi:hypothetical protein